MPTPTPETFAGGLLEDLYDDISQRLNSGPGGRTVIGLVSAEMLVLQVQEIVDFLKEAGQRPQDWTVANKS